MSSCFNRSMAGCGLRLRLNSVCIQTNSLADLIFAQKLSIYLHKGLKLQMKEI